MSLAPDLHLFIGNKNYSSWSFRPWIAMKVAGIGFRETLVPFDDDSRNQHFAEFSPSQKVPVLEHGDLSVWESLAILEYLADLYPDRGLWPENLSERARARSAANEMHGGFSALRSECPMNMRRQIGSIDVSEGVRADVRRIETIWNGCLEHSGGPFLFGRFSNADAMYAPVVNRLRIYELSDNPAVETYSNSVMGLPAWQEWHDAGVAEPWIVEGDVA